MITMLDGNRPWETVYLAGRDLVSLFEGIYSGDPIYGVAAGEPVVMDMAITKGRVTAASQVYLP